MNRFNQQLADCQRTVGLVLGSINLIISSRTSERLLDEFKAQETALQDLNTQLRKHKSLPAPDIETDIDNGLDVSSTLQETCKQTLEAMEATRTGQKFGDMLTDDRSIAMQGIVGARQEGVEQAFGKLTTTKESRAFQGQMSSEAFCSDVWCRFFLIAFSRVLSGIGFSRAAVS